MRKTFDFSRGWRYKVAFSEEMLGEDYDDSSFESVDLPHTNKELPFNYFDDRDYQFISCYRKKLDIKKVGDRTVLINFEGIMTYAELFVNGMPAGKKAGGYTDFLCDITGFLHDGENVLAVKVDSRERPDIPPFGGVIDYLTYGGIYREAQLIYVSGAARITDLFCRAEVSDKCVLKVDVKLENADGATVSAAVYDGGRLLRRASVKAENGKALISIAELEVERWDINNPKLYKIRVKAGQDNVSTRFGFREISFTEKGFFLNGRQIKLRGLNRHQSYAYAGYAMPKNAQVLDADILKKELALNVVRTSHYPQSRHFLDRCDEIGLLVVSEIPGWQHIGDAAWKDLAVQNVADMVIRDRNRPSVILWSIRINESDDDHDFYTRTNELCRQLDPTRPTTGVRWRPDSESLEDVHGMNDFMPAEDELCIRPQKLLTGLSYEKPYLVTEYMGHMFPTKIYDNEERLVKHALRHAEIVDAIAGDADKAGGIGWCAFDYNTHREFGTNDKICYHGVCDMFRNPKYAAYVYASQADAAEKLVMEPATIWAFGEKNIGGVAPLVVFSNCDYILLKVEGQETVKILPDRERFPNLPHPPFILYEMRGFWGETWKDAILEGYVAGGIAAEKRLLCSPLPDKLELILSNTEIPVNDVVRIAARATDAAGSTMKFLHDTLHIYVKGAKLVGPSEVVLQGGVYAFYVRSTKKATVSVVVSSGRFKENKVSFNVV